LAVGLVVHLVHETLVLSASTPAVWATLLRADLLQGAGLVLLALALFVWLRLDTPWALVAIVLLALLFLTEGVGHLRGLIAGHHFAPDISGLVAVVCPFVLLTLSVDVLLYRIYPDRVAADTATLQRDRGPGPGEGVPPD
jgi:hypothetical protein